MTQKPLPNTYWVEPGQFLAGEYPGGRSPGAARVKLRLLLEHGLTRFIDLTESHELESYSDILSELGAQLGLIPSYTRHPVPDVQIPRSAREMAEILDSIDASLYRAEKVYVHCWGGIGRTGTVVGCYFVRRGLSGEEALAKLEACWKTCDKSSRRPDSPETEEQRSYVRRWRELQPK